MADPVIASDGHAYEREAILTAWAAARERHANPQSHGACCGTAVAPFALLSPVTNEPVSARLTTAHIVVALTEALVDGGYSDLSAEEAADWRTRRAAVTEARRNGIPLATDPSDLEETAGQTNERPPRNELLSRVIDVSTPSSDDASRGRLGGTTSNAINRVRRSLSFGRTRTPSTRIGSGTATTGAAPQGLSLAGTTTDGDASGAESTEAMATDTETTAHRRLRLRIDTLEEQLPALRTLVASARGQAAQEAAVLELSRVEYELDTTQVEPARVRSVELAKVGSSHNGLRRSRSFARPFAGIVRSAMDTCQQIQQKAEARRTRKEALNGVSELLRTELRRGLTKPCPCCKLAITKNGGCHHHVCPACDTKFCWRCGRYNEQTPTRPTCGSTCSRPPRVWWKESDVMAHYRRQMAA